MGKRRKRLRRQQLRASTLDALIAEPIKEAPVPAAPAPAPAPVVEVPVEVPAPAPAPQPVAPVLPDEVVAAKPKAAKAKKEE